MIDTSLGGDVRSLPSYSREYNPPVTQIEPLPKLMLLGRRLILLDRGNRRLANMAGPHQPVVDGAVVCADGAQLSLVAGILYCAAAACSARPHFDASLLDRRLHRKGMVD